MSENPPPTKKVKVMASGSPSTSKRIGIMDVNGGCSFASLR